MQVLKCMCRFVIMMAEQYDYFFILYIVGFCAEGWLAVLALFHYPSDDHLEAIPDDPSLMLYEVSQPQIFLYATLLHML